MHADRFHVRIGAGERSQKAYVRVTGQRGIDGQLREDVNCVPNLVYTSDLPVDSGEGAVGDAPLRREGEVVP